MAAKSLPGVPVDITLEVRFEYVARAVVGDEGDGWAADGATKTEETAFHEFGF